MTPTESEWTRIIMRQMTAMGCTCITLSASKRQMLGVPDRWVCGPQVFGFACWLEFKGKRTQIRLDQKLLLGRIRARAPWAAYVVRWPGLVTDENGVELAEFDGTGRDLMEALCILHKSYNSSATTSS